MSLGGTLRQRSRGPFEALSAISTHWGRPPVGPRPVAWDLMSVVRDRGTTVVLVTHFMDVG